MTTKQKIIVSASSLLALALVAYLVLLIYEKVLEKKNEKDDTNKNGSGDGNNSNGSVNTTGGTTAPMPVFPLKYGSGMMKSVDMTTTRDNVKVVQQLCNEYGSDLIVDGKWGNNTEAAVDVLVTKAYSDSIVSAHNPVINGNSWQISEDGYSRMTSSNIGSRVVSAVKKGVVWGPLGVLYHLIKN